MHSPPHAQFLRELRALLRAPYALIHLQTFEEERAQAILRTLAGADNRALHTWSPLTGFDGSPNPGSLADALDAVSKDANPGVFVFKDIHALLDAPEVRRRLREMEGHCAAARKTIVFLGPLKIEAAELQKDLTHIEMPLPGRAVIRRDCDNIFPPEQFPHINHEALVDGAVGLTARQAFRAFHRVRSQYEEALQRNQPFDLETSILREKQRLIGASDILEFFPLEQGLSDVGGLDALKRWLAERKRAFSEEASAFGLPSPKGLLLLGVQGCGKSLSAKAVARYWGLPLLRLDLGVIFDGKRSPEDALRQALRTAEAVAPCVLWMDEIEKGFGEGADASTARVLGSLLTWQQEKTAPVFLVATANDVTALPPEMLRKGRFDEIFFVDLPDPHERVDIFRIHLHRRGRHFDDAVLQELAARTEHFSGAEVEQVVIDAMYVAFEHQRDIEAEDLEFAAREIIPLYRTYEDEIKALREWAHGRARGASHERRILDYFD